VLRAKSVAVVVPARNEQDHIVETLRTIPRWVDVVVVVDDGSTDATAHLAIAEGVHRRVEIVRHAESRGVGAAILAGYRRALERGADVVAVMAGDGQMHPDDLELLVGPVIDDRCDYAKGNRLDHPGVLGTMPLHRLAAGVVLSRLTGLAVGLPALRDSQSGYTAISRAALSAIALDEVWPGYGYPNDLLAAICRRGLRHLDVVVRPVYRGEASGLRPWHLATIGFLIARAFARRVVQPAKGSVSSATTAARTPPWPLDAQGRPREPGTPAPRSLETAPPPLSP
jgi:glycosyltransferase involved in cell wall biosynthesis